MPQDVTSWTTPDDLRNEVMSYWTRGRILAAGVTGEPLFPLKLTMRKPDAAALGRSFEAVRLWIRELEDNSRTAKGFGYDIEWTEINHRQLGRNRMPRRIWVATEADALRLIGREREGRQFRKLTAATTAQFPLLAGLLSRKPLTMLRHADDWPRILAVLAWFRAHPCSNVYLRQADIPGVDTKFVEARRALFSELLDIVLERQPAGDQPLAAVPLSFEQKYGLREKPPLVRFRVLDRALAVAGLNDITVPACEFAALNIAARHVFITENEINGLAFPGFPDAIVIFKLGYGVDLLQPASWLSRTRIHYWGDIDTHGFAILNRLRSMFPAARSLLMDRKTLMAHRPFWVTEDSPSRAALSNLDAAEQALFDDLIHDRLGEKVRLEQELVSYACLEAGLKALTS
ncbi:MAG: hypothetical protein J2P53_00030 [Bradyrhizobiaceae bacterium]|nr:hypothetical protein [Bradyrhizobiaceae bacterium]